jgi:hypothetical protein
MSSGARLACRNVEPASGPIIPALLDLLRAETNQSTCRKESRSFAMAGPFGEKAGLAQSIAQMFKISRI